MKYTARPNISLNVVINGPDAAAGFIPNLSNMIGVMVPEREASKTTLISEAATTIEI